MTKKTKILVVDDDSNLRTTLADILTLKGYEPIIAGSAADAMTALTGNGVSLALVDLFLPDMSGLELMGRIKAISPLTEVIILTGHVSMDTLIEATDKGAYSCVLKPFQMDDVLQKIRQGVERHHAQEEIIRLASFPRLHPNPVIELDASGVTYANPAAEKLFPDLKARGLAHPLLHGLTDAIAPLRLNKCREEVTHEAELGGATYELHVSCVEGIDLIRIFALDITQRKRAEREIRVLATTDGLTGIANRREFARLLEYEMERARRYGMPMSLAMYDLDHFKEVNDRYGHDAGDEVLKTVTGLVRQNIRIVDTPARWGGEEFMVLMPQSDLGAAKNAAEKLRLAIAHHRFGKVSKITVSFGVTEFVLRDDSNSLLKRVDDALYMAKQHGRNRVETLSAQAAVVGSRDSG